jgi:hypothetical protein
VSWIIAFFALFLTDVCWAKYVTQVQSGAAFASSLWASALFLFGAVAVVAYTTNPWLLIPSAAGAFVGTYVSVWHDRRTKAAS